MKEIGTISIKEIKTDKKFYNFAAAFAGKKGTVILLSGGEGNNARYNIVAADPWLEISSKGKSIIIREKEKKTEISEDPFLYLKDLTESLTKSYKKIEKKHNFPELPISTGLFGYLSYDLKDQIEEITRTTIDDLNLPDLYMISPGLIIVEDRFTDKIYRIVTEPVTKGKSSPESLLDKFENLLNSNYKPGKFSIPNTPLKSNFNREDYEDSINDIIEYIKSGDIYQVNMSQRFSTDFSGDSYSLFLELFEENPAPFFAYLNCGDHQIVSTSPERFILQEGNRVEARPIKGTRPRGQTPEEDEKLKQELKNSLKDDAELSMIVDLLRNDMGKVCKGGSVRVLEHKTMTAYKNVYHLVSTIEGFLEENKGSVDLIKAAFPGGSITGCPKIRSMEIIDEKEPYRRHIYTGSIGYIGFNGRMDLSIVIRTATITRGKLFFSVGGGIVYDSVPEDEFEETLHKARSLMKVLNRHKRDYPTEENNNYCWYNGKFIQETDAYVPVQSRGFQFGAGIFETLKVDNGNIEYLEEHLKRLENGCKDILGMELPNLDWQDIADLLIAQNGLSNTLSVMKIIISEGKNGLFGELNIVITCREYKIRDGIQNRGKLTLGIYPHKRENFLADYKTTNYLFYLKAGEWAKTNGYDEAVILNGDGSVSETNTGNIHIVQDKTVIIPESNHRLPGIMERKVVEDYKSRGFEIISQKIFPDDFTAGEQYLSKTSRIFITNSLIGTVEVSTINRKS